MFDLKNHTYNEVLDFLVSNYEKREIKPCCNESDALKGIDIPESLLDEEYELFIVTLDYEYFDDPEKNIYGNSVSFDKCYYYSLKFRTDFFLNELGVIDSGGYYIAVCVFHNKVNITEDVVYVSGKDKPEDRFFKYQMNTVVGRKDEFIPKRELG